MTEQPSSRREPEANGPGQGGRVGRGSNGGAGRGSATDSWERRAADLAGGVQRWLIRTSAKNMRDELSDQVKKALRGEPRDAGDVWATATTEPPGAASEAPECAWCPICRAARRLAESRAEPRAGSGSAGSGSAGSGSVGSGSAGAVLADAADVVSGAVRDVLATVDSILSYRPGDGSAASASSSSARSASDGAAPASAAPASAGPADAPRPAPGADDAREPADEPDDRS